MSGCVLIRHAGAASATLRLQGGIPLSYQAA